MALPPLTHSAHQARSSRCNRRANVYLLQLHPLLPLVKTHSWVAVQAPRTPLLPCFKPPTFPPQSVPQAPGPRAQAWRVAPVLPRDALRAPEVLGQEVQLIRGGLIGKLMQPFLGRGGGGLDGRREPAVRRKASHPPPQPPVLESLKLC